MRVSFAFACCYVASLFSCAAAPLTAPISVSKAAVEAVTRKHLPVDAERTVWIKGGIDDESADRFITDINNLDELDQVKPIYIIINSYGGSLDAGFRIQDNMDMLRAPTVCVVESEAASMASGIFLHCGTRYMQPHSTLMFHFGSLNLQGPRYEVVRRLEHALKQFDEFDADNASRLGMTVEEYKKWIEHDQWITQDQALEMGIIADIVTVRVKPPAPPPPVWVF